PEARTPRRPSPGPRRLPGSRFGSLSPSGTLRRGGRQLRRARRRRKALTSRPAAAPAARIRRRESPRHRGTGSRGAGAHGGRTLRCRVPRTYTAKEVRVRGTPAELGAPRTREIIRWPLAMLGSTELG